MEPLTPTIFIVTCIIGGIAVIAFLHLLSATDGHEIAVHKLRNEVIEARNRYIRHVRGTIVPDVDIVEDDPLDT